VTYLKYAIGENKVTFYAHFISAEAAFFFKYNFFSFRKKKTKEEEEENTLYSH
jgi:hypothetical protein